MQYIEYLAGLGNGTEQRVVTALALFLSIETDSGTFGQTTSADDRGIWQQATMRYEMAL